MMMTTTTLSVPSSSNNNNNNRAIKWGIVGLGDVCQLKSGPAFWKCEGSELVAVMRRTPGKAQEYAQNVVPAGGNISCQGYDNLDQFLQHKDMDAVYVATRPGTHLEICRKVVAANKACYVEKPVGRCAAETEEIVRMFEENKLPLYTAYISRAYDRTQMVRKLLNEGALGDVTSISYKLVGTGGARDMAGDFDLPWRLDASQSGGGLIMDVGCHVVDRIDYLCGPMENVKGFAENRRSNTNVMAAVEDYVEFTATIGESDWAAANKNCKGAKVHCVWDFASSSNNSEEEEPCDDLIIQGSNGRYLKLAGMLPAGPVSLYDENDGLVREYSFEMPQHTAQQLIQAVTNDLRGVDEGERADFLSFGDNAIRAEKVLDAVLTSYYGGREIGYWERVDSWPGRKRAAQSSLDE